MSEKAPEPFPIFKTAIKYKDVFDINGLYALLHFWLIERGWVDIDVNNPDMHETSYLEKISSTGAKTHIIVWQLQKIPEKSKFFKWTVKINLNTSDLNTVEIMSQGKKIKANKGGVDITIEAKMQIDYLAMWANHPFLALFKQWFEKKVYKQEINRMKNELFGEMTEYQARIKQYLELKQFLSSADIKGFTPSGVFRG